MECFFTNTSTANWFVTFWKQKVTKDFGACLPQAGVL
jgi:hypothetical protein